MRRYFEIAQGMASQAIFQFKTTEVRRNAMKKVIALTLTILMIFSLCACGGQSQESSNAPIVFTYAAPESITSLDLNNSTFIELQSIAALYGDAIIKSEVDGSYVNWLATDISWSDDYLTCDITLRDNVDFSNGKHMTAYDYVGSVQRILNDETLHGYSHFTDVESIEQTGDYTCRVKFKTVPVLFNDYWKSICVIDIDAYNENPETFFDAPITTGSFTVSSFDPVTCEIHLTRNDSWWGWEAFGGQKTNVDEIVFKCINEDTTRVSALRTGEIDFAKMIPADNVATIKGEGFNVESFSRNEAVYVGLQVDGIFQDQKIREAFSYCINRPLLVASVVGGGEACTWPCLPMNEGFNGSVNAYPFDLDHAKQCLAESSYNGEEVNVIIATSKITRGNEVIQAITNMMEAAGFKVNVETLEFASFADRRSAGTYDVHISAFTFSSSYAELTSLIGTDRMGTHFLPDDLKDVISRLTGVGDPAKREALCLEGLTLVANYFDPVVPLYQTFEEDACKPNITGIGYSSAGWHDFRYMQVGE